jgi:G3E family GTPase
METEASRTATPIYLLTGFLGSGKTTLLQRALAYYEASGRKAAVVMNELGEANVEAAAVGSEVPMAELLGGCICCSSRGNAAGAIEMLVKQHHPDVILIESTGAANPLEAIDGITEAALVVPIALRSVVTVVDGPGLLEHGRRGKGRTYKLMRDQIRAATQIVLNKADKLHPEERVLLEQTIREWNGVAELTVATRCEVDAGMFDERDGGAVASIRVDADAPNGGSSCGCGELDCAGHEHDHAGDGPVRSHAHAGHSHVMALTHELRGAVDSEAFEAFLASLPNNVYRAKGIVTFRDTGGRFLFQFAYRESDFMRLAPDARARDVVVLIGEHFLGEPLAEKLDRLVD